MIRYTVKLMYDEVSLGEVEDLTELAEYLNSYSTDYFIGPEDDDGWTGGVAAQLPHLFALGRDSEKVTIVHSDIYSQHVVFSTIN